jgi:selenide,water dikinase|eukprot:g1626.t1
MNDVTPIFKDLVLIGGGHAHVNVLKMFGMEPEPGVKLTLISRDIMTPYSGMLPGHVAGHYTYDECHIDLPPLAKFANCRFIHAEADGIDTVNKTVRLKAKPGCTPRPPISYDVLSVDIGINPAGMGSGAQSKGQKTAKCGKAAGAITPVKPINSFSERWNDIRRRIQVGHRESTPSEIVVVGGGAGGIELALAMQYQLNKDCEQHGNVLPPRFTILTRGDDILSSHNPRVRRTFRKILNDRKVKVFPNSAVEKTVVRKNGVTKKKENLLVCSSGDSFSYDECIWCTTAAAQKWLETDTSLELDKDGFIALQDTLESTNTPDVFAAGDVASVLNHPRPKAGVFAVRQGMPLAANLRHRLRGEPVVPFYPQKEFLGLISTGDKYAVASRGCWSFGGSYLWYIKDWIDRAFMAKFQDLPDMAAKAAREEARKPKPAVALAAGPEAINLLSHVAMRCGGCGSKIGASVLSRVMKRLKGEIHTRPEVIIGLDAPDDAAVVQGLGKKMAAIHTVDFFRSFIDDPYTFGRIAANHALSDCHAMCAEPRTALAIATVPFAVEDKVEETLYQMMSGACEALKESGCALVGGHSAEGPELSLGFAVNGAADKEQILRKEGLAVGDKIILTKPIGTGVVFAAEMRGKVSGLAVDAALNMMCMSNRKGALCLRDFGCKSCTDVTGFGLLGHLVEMMNASGGVSVNIDLKRVPILPGAVDCVKRGIFSSLQPQNVRLRRAVDTVSQKAASQYSEYPLLFDPQTAGGLLASVPGKKAAACIKALKELGYVDASVIGDVISSASVQAGGAVIIDCNGMGEGKGGSEVAASSDSEKAPLLSS